MCQLWNDLPLRSLTAPLLLLSLLADLVPLSHKRFSLSSMLDCGFVHNDSLFWQDIHSCWVHFMFGHMTSFVQKYMEIRVMCSSTQELSVPSHWCCSHFISPHLHACNGLHKRGSVNLGPRGKTTWKRAMLNLWLTCNVSHKNFYCSKHLGFGVWSLSQHNPA